MLFRSLENQLKRFVNKFKLMENIKFFGKINHQDLSKYYQSCSVFVLPSKFETQGMVAIEAMHYSKPIIVTDSIISSSELVKYDNGFIVSSINPKDLAEKLIILKENKELRNNMGKKSKKLSEQYSKEKIVNVFENICHNLLNNS